MHCVVHDLEGSFPLAEAYLRSMINGNYRSLIDLCCCHAQLTGVLGFEKRRYLDVIERTLAHPSEQNFFVQTDVLKEHELFNEHWDVATCLDGIEHVTKEQGLLLRDRMVAIADLSHQPILGVCRRRATTSGRIQKVTSPFGQQMISPDGLPSLSNVIIQRWELELFSHGTTKTSI